jgi:uncharacterized protein YlzI (FlbEa/FlbD family)
MKTTITLPNGARVIINDNSDKSVVAMFIEAIKRFNKE